MGRMPEASRRKLQKNKHTERERAEYEAKMRTTDGKHSGTSGIFQLNGNTMQHEQHV